MADTPWDWTSTKVVAIFRKLHRDETLRDQGSIVTASKNFSPSLSNGWDPNGRHPLELDLHKSGRHLQKTPSRRNVRGQGSIVTASKDFSPSLSNGWDPNGRHPFPWDWTSTKVFTIFRKLRRDETLRDQGSIVTASENFSSSLSNGWDPNGRHPLGLDLHKSGRHRQKTPSRRNVERPGFHHHCVGKLFPLEKWMGTDWAFTELIAGIRRLCCGGKQTTMKR